MAFTSISQETPMHITLVVNAKCDTPLTDDKFMHNPVLDKALSLTVIWCEYSNHFIIIMTRTLAYNLFTFCCHRAKLKSGGWKISKREIELNQQVDAKLPTWPCWRHWSKVSCLVNDWVQFPQNLPWVCMKDRLGQGWAIHFPWGPHWKWVLLWRAGSNHVEGRTKLGHHHQFNFIRSKFHLKTKYFVLPTKSCVFI